MSRIDEILNIANHVPPFPKVALQIMKMLDDPEVKAKDLAEVIQYDAAITVNILKTCNAAYFGLTRKVSSLDDALVVLGQDILKDILMASSSAKFYKGEAGVGYSLEQGDLWKHSVATAVMAKLISSHFDEVDSGTAFTAGLLHDIGKRFLSSFVADDFQKIMTLAHNGQSSFIEAEKEICGMNHAELGGLILGKWEFADNLRLAVQQHHDPDALDKGQLTALLAISNTLVISLGIGVGADGLSSTVQGQGLKRFAIESRDLDKYLVDLVFELEKAEEMLSLAG